MSSINYLADPNLKRVGVEYGFTQAQIDEYTKCKTDPVYFVRQWMKIRHVDRGLINFDLYDYQERLLRQLIEERFNIVTQCRQSGKCLGFSTMISIRNKETGEEMEISLGQFYLSQLKKDRSHDEVNIAEQARNS